MFPLLSLTSFKMFFIRVLTTNNILLSKLEIGSSITSNLSSEILPCSNEPFAICKKYKKVINVISPSLNVDSARDPSSLCIS